MFLLDDGNIAATYTLPFLVGLAMPGQRSLVATGWFAFGIAVLATVMADGSLGAAFGLLFVLTAMGGLGCGVLTRALTLWIPPRRRHPLLFVAIAVLGYALPLVAVSGPAQTMAWLKRPSQKVCAAATYRMTAAGMPLHVRAAPFFAVDELGKPGAITPHFMSFDSDVGLKEICGRGLRDNQVIGPVAIHLSPWKAGSSKVQDWAKATCGSTSDRTLSLLCGLMDKTHPARKLEGATIYGQDMDAAMAGKGAYAVDKRLRQRAGESNEPFLIVCEGDESSSFERALLCAAQEISTDGWRIKFVFRTSSAARTAESDAIRAYLHDLIASFSPAAQS